MNGEMRRVINQSALNMVRTARSLLGELSAVDDIADEGLTDALADLKQAVESLEELVEVDDEAVRTSKLIV